MRSFGALAFGKIYDGTTHDENQNQENLVNQNLGVQVVFETDINIDALKFFTDTVDVGDFIQVTGTNYITKKGENSILVTEVKLLTKALLPLPKSIAEFVLTVSKFKDSLLPLRLKVLLLRFRFAC